MPDPGGDGGPAGGLGCPESACQNSMNKTQWSALDCQTPQKKRDGDKWWTAAGQWLVTSPRLTCRLRLNYLDSERSWHLCKSEEFSFKMLQSLFSFTLIFSLSGTRDQGLFVFDKAGNLNKELACLHWGPMWEREDIFGKFWRNQDIYRTILRSVIFL